MWTWCAPAWKVMMAASRTRISCPKSDVHEMDCASLKGVCMAWLCSSMACAWRACSCTGKEAMAECWCRSMHPGHTSGMANLPLTPTMVTWEAPPCQCHAAAGLTPYAQDMMVWEAQLARRQRHANVMPLLASFLHGQELWLILPLCVCTLRSLLDQAYPQVRRLAHLSRERLCSVTSMLLCTRCAARQALRALITARCKPLR